MPKVKSEDKQPIDVFKFHGVDFNKEGKNSEAECPFCGRENKFIVKDTGQFRCLVCDESGNAVSFVSKLWEQSFEDTTQDDYEELAEDRGQYIAGFKQFGLAKSFLSGNWLIPGFNGEGKLNQLYHRLGKFNMASPTLGQGILNAHNYDPTLERVDLLEGCFDGAAWATAFKSGINILAVPGCNSFYDTWLTYFRGKKVRIFFDSDHERKHPKKDIMLEGAGFKALRKVATKIRQVTDDVEIALWGEKGYNPEWESGTDIRDIFNGKVEL